MNETFRIAAIVFILCFGASIGWGAGKTLVIDHKAMKVFVDEGNHRERDVKYIKGGEKDIREIRNREEITIVLRHKNPVLFEYTWKGIQKEKTEDYQVALKLAETLKKVIDPFLPKTIEKEKKSGEDREKSFGGKAPRYLTERNAYLGKLEKKLEENNYNKLFNKLDDMLGHADRIPALIKTSIGTDEEIRKAKSEIQDWNIGSLDKDVTDLFAKIDALQIDYLKNPQSGQGGQIISFGTSGADEVDIQLVLFAKDQQANIMKVLESLKTFAKAFQAIALTEDDDMRLDSVVYSSMERAAGTLLIKSAVPDLSDATIKSQIDSHTGTYELRVEPYAPVRFTLKPTLVYSFAKDANGKSIGWLTPLVFGIIPRFLDDPIFGGELQLGILLENDKQGFFVGGGIKIYTNIFLGGGATYQQAGKDHYVWGGYLNIAYDLK